jgi:hypothetical protein
MGVTGLLVDPFVTNEVPGLDARVHIASVGW